MKIINLVEFLELPAGTLFSKYQPSVFEELMIKGDTWEHDFLYQDTVSAIKSHGSSDMLNKLDDAEKNGASVDMDFNGVGRDGCYDDEQLFSVWESEDLNRFMIRLKECACSAYGQEHQLINDGCPKVK